MSLKLHENFLGYEEADADAVVDLALDAKGDPVRGYLKRAAMGELTAQELGYELMRLLEDQLPKVRESEGDDYIQRDEHEDGGIGA